MTATQEILAELARTVGSASSKAFVAALTEGEGGIFWNILFGAGTLLAPTAGVSGSAGARLWTGSTATFPTWGGAKLSNGSITHAAGAAQFEPSTWLGISRMSGRSDFSAQSQIQNTWDLAAQVFLARTGTFLHDALEAGGSYLNEIHTNLMSTWPGGCDGKFPTRFTANLPAVSTHLVIRKVGRATAILP